MKGSFGALDAIFLGLGGLATLALAPMRLIVVPRFLVLMRDFASELPWSTHLVATPAFWWVTGLGCAGLLVAGGAIKLLRGSRAGTLLLGTSALVAATTIVFTLWALYAPIWEMAENVRAE